MARKTPQKKGTVVDCHTHVKWYGYDAARIVANMDESGIDVTWLLTWEAPPHEIDQAGYARVFWPGRQMMPFEDVIEAVYRYPARLVPFYAPDPRQPHAIRLLESAVSRVGVRGFGEMKVRMLMDDPRALEVFHFCGERGLPVIFHMDVPLPRHDPTRDPGYWYCCDWENLARALEQCRKTVFLGHGPGFWREISADADSSPDPYPQGAVKPGGRLMKFLDSHPNLGCDLSASSGLRALSRDLAVGRKFLEKYQERCLFGRDSFDHRLQEFIRECRLSPVVYRKIMGENALRIVPLTSGK
jgi:predicted TIM-barrel fold metal-dependent hydrolase